MRIFKLAVVVMALAACQPAVEEAASTPEPTGETYVASEAAPTATPAQPSGPPQPVEAEDDHMPEAWVTDVHNVKDADFRIFSTAGGDPAINGLYTYVAAYTPPDGWTRVYMIGDFNSWEVVEETPTRVVLKISRSWIDDATGDVKTADEKLILDLPADGTTPLTVTPAA
jgi:hypothetical protein